MYETWQRRIFQFLPFDSFLEELEKLGQTAAMKVRVPASRGGSGCFKLLIC